ncbi:MAG: cytochrome b/b6 domain-containing protein [Pseudomonadota bacterium]|nr:cytochrome b/b6 domain-containing protein [Pseudomonadota bacterium]
MATIYRHSLATRLLHWINALCVFVVLMSGLQIFNAHPNLYWGKSGADPEQAAFQITSRNSQQGDAVGLLRIGKHQINSTGVLGVSGDGSERAFPGWATIPGERFLAAGRRWHFFFAWLLVINSTVYFAVSLARGHLKRDLLPTRTQLSPSHLIGDLWNHLQLKFPSGEAARGYNALQKITYLGVLFILAPTILATGLTMSPGMDAGFPWLLDLFAGRQSARTVHFICAALVVAFIAVHLIMVLLAGPINELRSMITGRYVLPPKEAE